MAKDRLELADGLPDEELQMLFQHSLERAKLLTEAGIIVEIHEHQRDIEEIRMIIAALEQSLPKGV